MSLFLQNSFPLCIARSLLLDDLRDEVAQGALADNGNFLRQASYIFFIDVGRVCTAESFIIVILRRPSILFLRFLSCKTPRFQNAALLSPLSLTLIADVTVSVRFITECLGATQPPAWCSMVALRRVTLYLSLTAVPVLAGDAWGRAG